MIVSTCCETDQTVQLPKLVRVLAVQEGARDFLGYFMLELSILKGEY